MSNDLAIALDASQVNKAIDKLVKAGKTKPLMDDIGRTLLADTQLNFKQQQAPDGTPWAATQRGGHILRDTGRLRNSLRYDVVGIDTVIVGTNVAYGAFHQHGTQYLTARPFMGLETKQVTQINNAIDVWAESLLD